MKKALLMVGALASIWYAAGVGVARAAPAQGPVTKTNTVSALLPNTYWTPARFQAAKALDLPLAAPGQRHESLAAPAAAAGKPQSGDPGLPSVEVNGAVLNLFASLDPRSPSLAVTEGPVTAAVTNALDVTPSAAGTFGAYFTSSRVFPLFTGAAAAYSADRAYPYRTVGKLFFSINGAPYLCSASVIQRRVVATAGHCVHSGNLATGFYSDFVFVPAYRDGAAPFKAWNWRLVSTTYAWATGNDVVPNAADYAMIEFDDQPLSTGGAAVKLGNVTGWLGWQTNSLQQNHTSKLGYPCNLDACQKMQNVTSNGFQRTEPNNVEYGSDARGGSSGGPWVQNFQVLQTGGGTGLQTGSNRVVGITSYGYVSEAPKVQGSSILDARWVQLFNSVCGARSGNCN
ncbi:trypsin-like serine peptidase [Massilia sp. DWR3-1-1]|uniref:trypsin-like serine peptidase n=1 Tax=Massilia sp. DWR3-1-1 TaxID=2804559 RepID=UPI003CF4FC09